ncbi:hypothetical protein LEN26_004969, partial [Aphanomyces euteiches]
PNVRAQYDREYYAKNKTKVLHVQRVYREKNKDHYKLWYQQNKARVLARVKLNGIAQDMNVICVVFLWQTRA